MREACRETMDTDADSLLSVRPGPVFTGLAGAKAEKFQSFPDHPLYGFPIVDGGTAVSVTWGALCSEVLSSISDLNRASPFRRGERIDIVLAKEGRQAPANTSITDSSRDSSWNDACSRRDCLSIDLTPIHPVADITSSSGSTVPDDFKPTKKQLRSYRRAWRDASNLEDSESSLDSSDSSKPALSRLAEMLPEDSQFESRDMFKSTEALVTAGVIKEEETEDDLDISMEPEPLVPLQTQQKAQMPTFCPVPAKELLEGSSDFLLDFLAVERPNAFSPLYRKFVICEDGRHRRSLSDPRLATKSVALLHAFPCSGYRSSLTLEFSAGEKNSRALLDAVSEARRLPCALLTQNTANWTLSCPVAWLSCGFEHMAIVTIEGEVFTWGYGSAGTLGHGDCRSYSEPQRVKTLCGKGISYIECGGYHTAALSETGRLWMWGRGDVNQLGIAKSRLTEDEFGHFAAVPMEIDDLKSGKRTICGVACGEAHTLILTSEGEAYSCGWAEDGQLGLPDSALSDGGTVSSRISQIPSLAHVVKVAAGALFSAALTAGGSVYVWGNGEQGQLGLGSRLKRAVGPTAVQSISPDGILDLVCGENSVMCVSSTGRAYGWGSGVAGEMESGQFPCGSALVCYVPRELREVRIAHLLRLPRRSVHGRQDDLLMSLQEELRRLE